MRPEARVQAAIDCLEVIFEGAPAEQALTRWARGARYAGSGDRAAVRDHVYDSLRQRRSASVLGGGTGARAVMLGVLRGQGADVATLFGGGGHGPVALSAAERAALDAPAPAELPADLPDWLLPPLRARHGAELTPMLAALRDRAPVFLRINPRRADGSEPAALLAEDGIETAPCALAGALRVIQGARRLAQSRVYLGGLVELQDLSSQAAMAMLPLPEGGRILDYCAGGGGKTLAMAGRVSARFHAHDALPRRMADLPARAARAGISVDLIGAGSAGRAAPYDLVLCDVPCSGSGTWRRDPDAKWRFMPEDLARLIDVQDRILDEAAALVVPGGTLAYATCSLLEAENEARIDAFLARSPGWRPGGMRQWRLDEGGTAAGEGGDGFFVAHLTRE